MNTEGNTGARSKNRILFIVIGLIVSLIVCCIVIVALMSSGAFSQRFDSVAPEPTFAKEVKPPYYGVFVKQNGELIELQELEIFSIPTEGEVNISKTISDSQPILIVWRQNLNLDYLELYKLNPKLGQPKNQIIYRATPREEGIVEIVPSKPLDNGVYCLIQGDPFAAILPGWCFGIGSISAGQHLATSTSTSEECVRYDPSRLRIVNLDALGWALTAGSEQVALLDNEPDAKQALELAKRYTMTCFIGNQKAGFHMQYWDGLSGLSSDLIDRDCSPYNPNNVEVVSTGNHWTLVEGGSHNMVALDSRTDAEAALQIVKQYTQICFIGRDNNRSNRIDYIVAYWR